MAIHPNFPVVEGYYQMTSEWAIVLPSKFNRRIEDGDLVLWQPGFTAWIAVWENNKNETKEQRLAWVKTEQSPDSQFRKEKRLGSLLLYTYRLAEVAEDNRIPALYCYAFADKSHVQMAIYFDKEESLSTAEELCFSLTNIF
jgi:hypothetical protein